MDMEADYEAKELLCLFLEATPEKREQALSLARTLSTQPVSQAVKP